MVEKIKKDEDYKKEIKKKIEELKVQGVFVLNRGMLEHYLNSEGDIIGGNKEKKERELKEIFEIE